VPVCSGVDGRQADQSVSNGRHATVKGGVDPDMTIIDALLIVLPVNEPRATELHWVTPGSAASTRPAAEPGKLVQTADRSLPSPVASWFRQPVRSIA
jgi:hypothetical protein